MLNNSINGLDKLRQKPKVTNLIEIIITPPIFFRE